MLNKNAPNFALHTPSAQQLERQHQIAALAQTYASSLVDICPAGPELEEALSTLRVSTMWANQSVISGGLSAGVAR
jgi:hypothetical protein